jgi:hypothetical protein
MTLALTFGAAILAVLRRHLQISCTCFGRHESAISPVSLTGPAMIGTAALLSLTSPHWPGLTPVGFAAAAAGFYLLLLHRAALLILRT